MRTKGVSISYLLYNYLLYDAVLVYPIRLLIDHALRKSFHARHFHTVPSNAPFDVVSKRHKKKNILVPSLQILLHISE